MLMVPEVFASTSQMQISVRNASCRVGDTVSVAVNLTNVPSSGFASGLFNINYDNSKLIYQSYRAGEIVNNKSADLSVNANSGVLKIMYSDYDQTGSSHIIKNGELITLIFKVNGSETVTLAPNSTNKF